MFAYDIALSIELMTPVTVSKGVGSFMRYRFGYSRYVSRLNYHIIKNSEVLQLPSRSDEPGTRSYARIFETTLKRSGDEDTSGFRHGS
jgi:hypothetical protein